MQLKDHYRTLGVPPSATPLVIKKAYRTLAFKYHPDKNPGDLLSEAQFKELQEAYAILSDTGKRSAYDDERWLSGMGGKGRYNEAVTPAWLKKISVELTTELGRMDIHRISHSALQAYILLILSDAHLAVLQHGDTETRIAIIAELIRATKDLEARYLGDIVHRLVLLANGDEAIIADIHEHAGEKARKAQRERMLPYVVLIITVALCIAMYYYASLH